MATQASVTPETFGDEHFGKLIRGLTTARKAFERLQFDLISANAENDRLRTTLAGMEEEMRRAPSEEAWDALIGVIEDVGRGVRSLDELLQYAKEHA